MKERYGWKDDNENEIKKIIIIKVDNKYLSSFTYLYKFKTSGIHMVQYSFKNKLSNTNYLFSSYDHITKKDFSNFHSESLKRMNSMFAICKALTHLNLSNFNTDKVIDLDYDYIFTRCDSLKTKNVITKNIKILKCL